MTENLPILTGKILSLITLFGLYMRLLDCISIVNSKQGIVPSKGEHTTLLHRNGREPRVPLFDHLYMPLNQLTISWDEIETLRPSDQPFLILNVSS